MSGKLGELVPVGGGDAVPLNQEVITIGRRSSCDVQLDFQNVSGKHCELRFQSGYWYVQDLGSTNGIKVNGERVPKRPLRPGDELGIANHKFTIQYELAVAGSEALEEVMEVDADILSQSLLEKAGLMKPSRPKPGRQ